AFVLIDFRRVQGIDASAAFALKKLSRSCRENGVELFFSGLADRLQARLDRSGIRSESGAPHIVPKLDDALEIVEEQILAEAERADSEALGFLEELQSLYPDTDLRCHFEEIFAKAGKQIIEQGANTES